MSRIVVIEYDDPGVAQDQIIALRELSSEARVIGVFDTPDEFCECGGWTQTGPEPATPSVWIKELGQRYCLQCQKPFPVLSWIPNKVSADKIRNPTTHRVAGNDVVFYPIALSLTATKP